MQQSTDTMTTPLSALNAMLAAKRGQHVQSASVILDDLAKTGVHLFPTEDRTGLEVKTGQLSSDQRQIVRDHKAAILDHLTGPMMKFDFWVPQEADDIVNVLLVRMQHHDWAGDQITRRQYANLQDEFDAAWNDRNLERLKRAEKKLHSFLDSEPFWMDSTESPEGHGGRIWYDPATQGGLIGSVKPATFKAWRLVAVGVPQVERNILKDYLLEFKTKCGTDRCPVKIEDSGFRFER